MSFNRKLKPFTRKRITNIIEDYEERFESIADMLESLTMKQPDYSGALILTLNTDSDKLKSFYMVTGYCMEEPYMVFNHLVPVDRSNFGIESFPEKPDKMSTLKFIKSLEKDGKWNKIHEKFFIPSVANFQFNGKFTYTKTMSLEDVPFNPNIDKTDVVEFRKP
jgi:hypothetical protein